MAEQKVWLREEPGPATVTQVMDEFDELARRGEVGQFHPLSTGFMPLDDVLNGGIRPGELVTLAGPFGVGKTILALQMARNAVVGDAANKAIYVCYEHDRTHLLSRLICLESAQQGNGEGSLTLRKLSQLAFSPVEASGLITGLRHDRRYARVVDQIGGYADRLVLARASGAYTTLQDIERWVDDLRTPETRHTMLVVDYLQKIPLPHGGFINEVERTTALTQGLKELALSKGIIVVAIAAADRAGLRETRMRLADLRGSSALQYETDIGLVLNNKHDIVSREHLIYNLADAEAMRGWVVLSVEKNRAGRNAVDMEYPMDAAHFRIVPEGSFVRERLVDGKAVLA